MQGLLRRHAEETGSQLAQRLLDDLETTCARLTKVLPRDYSTVLGIRADAERDGLDPDGTEVHPNDHVNCSQSSNDVFPTSVHVAVTQGVVEKLLPALAHLAASLEAKAEALEEGLTEDETAAKMMEALHG